jgi:spore maturation protein A
MMDWVWAGLVVASLMFGALNGRLPEVSAAALEGVRKALDTCLGLCAGLCLWSGILKLLETGGASALLGRLLRPLLTRLYPEARRDREALSALAENMSANLLGLGNAATPAGIRAAQALKKGETATDSLCRLVVLNSASIQLIPATVCTLRAAAGAQAPFDILPAVWLASLCAALAGLGAEKLLRRAFR